MGRLTDFGKSRSALGKATAPPIVKRTIRTAVRLARRPTAAGRVFPNFFIIGAQRAGTTSMFHYLDRHPAVVGPMREKGVHYFDANYHRDLTWFRSHFPTAEAVAKRADATGNTVAVGEGSPYYLFHPMIPARVAGALPNARAIAILRDPVDRAISHHQHETARGHESLSLADAIAAEPDRLAGAVEALRADPTLVHYAHQHHAYVARGQYADQLERWFHALGRDQVLVVSSADLNERPADVVAETVAFLGLDPMPDIEYPRYNKREYDKGDAAIRSRLADAFADSNARVADLTGLSF